MMKTQIKCLNKMLTLISPTNGCSRLTRSLVAVVSANFIAFC